MRMDGVEHERVLLTPEELAQFAETPYTRDADGWVRFAGPGGFNATWPSPKPRDFAPCDMVSVSMRVDAPEWRLSAGIRLDSLEPNSDRHNRYRAGTPGPRTVQGEFRFDMPYENFHIDGFPPGWLGVDEFSLGASLPRDGSLAIGPVYLVQRSRASGPRLTDEELFGQELDLEAPGLEAVRQAVERGDMAAAGRELLRHLDTRKTVTHDFGTRGSAHRRANRTAADEFLAGVFSGQRFGDPIDWRANPNGYLEWRHAFNRHYCLGGLFHTWTQTGDDRYLVALDRAIARWMEVSPEPTGMNDGGGDPAWETLSVSCRVNWSWLDIFFGTAGAGSFRTRTRLDMLKSLIAHAEHLVRWQGGQNNWIIVESQAVATCGILFPELKRAEVWRRVGLERLTHHLGRQVWPDGVQKEVSPGYHWMSGRGFGDLMRLARSNGVDVPGAYADTVERMTEYHLFLARPDGSLPSFNDSGSADGRAGAALQFGADHFGRQDMRWLVTDRAEGTPPDHASHAFLDAGVYVMRSDWSPRANWLAFRGGNIGAGHLHEDRLGFDLTACGSPVLVDPGAANYKPDELRAWSTATRAHNTATIDGLSQWQRDRAWDERTASVRAINAWATSDTLDVAAARYVGPYGQEHEVMDVAHHREIHFIKPHFWVMVDAFLGDRPHTANLRFHFMPMVVCVGQDPVVIRTRRLNHPNLEILPVNWPAETRVATLCGSLDPTQGWVALGSEWAPATCVQADVPFEGSAVLVTLLIPLASGLTSSYVVTPQADGRYRVETPHGTHTLELRHTTFDPAEPVARPLARVTVT